MYGAGKKINAIIAQGMSGINFFETFFAFFDKLLVLFSGAIFMRVVFFFIFLKIFTPSYTWDQFDAPSYNYIVTK